MARSLNWRTSALATLSLLLAVASMGCMYRSGSYAIFWPGAGFTSNPHYRGSFEETSQDHYGFLYHAWKIPALAHSDLGHSLQIELTTPKDGARYVLPSSEGRAFYFGGGWVADHSSCKGTVEVKRLSSDSITLDIDLVMTGPDGQTVPFKQQMAFDKGGSEDKK